MPCDQLVRRYRHQIVIGVGSDRAISALVTNEVKFGRTLHVVEIYQNGGPFRHGRNTSSVAARIVFLYCCGVQIIFVYSGWSYTFPCDWHSNPLLSWHLLLASEADSAHVISALFVYVLYTWFHHCVFIGVWQILWYALFRRSSRLGWSVHHSRHVRQVHQGRYRWWGDRNLWRCSHRL